MFSFDMREQAAIAQTGFFVSLTSYAVFWLLDLVHPGFVARFFSVHVFLFGAIFFGVWWGSIVEEYVDRSFLQQILATACGVFLAMLTWNLSGILGGWRMVLGSIALFIPLLILRLVKYK